MPKDKSLEVVHLQERWQKMALVTKSNGLCAGNCPSCEGTGITVRVASTAKVDPSQRNEPPQKKARH